MFRSIERIYRKFFGPLLSRIEQISCEVELNRMLIAQSRKMGFCQDHQFDNLSDAEFRVFSQFGEDGIIQYLISKVPISNEIFVEFGVEDYRESNTRFLLMNNNWTGLVIDSDEANIARIRARDLFWRHDLKAICAFITKDNINRLIEGTGVSGDIGLLSIDIDGNDYWVWQAVTSVSPRIVIIEYNSLFGSRWTITVPYDEHFSRARAHYSYLYFGASLPALCRLADEKGYIFVGSNGAGTNAFFVRRDVAANISEVSCADGYVESRIRESRNEKGRLSFASGKERIKLIEDREVLNIETGNMNQIKDLLL